MQSLHVPIAHKSPILTGSNGIFDQWEGGVSVSLLLGVLTFISCSKGCWLVLKAVLDMHYWIFEANRHNKMFSRHLHD